MRVVAWNCRSGFGGKVPALLGLAPDVAVVCEAARLAKVPGSYAWVGEYPHKGLGVVAPVARLTPIAPIDGDGRWALACDVEHEDRTFGVLGAWTVPSKPAPSKPYVAALRGILARHAAWIRSKPTVIAGDFNVSGRTDPRELPTLMREFTALGLKSAWHAHTGEVAGEESAPTLWWRGREEAGFHCDFVFVPQTWAVTGVAVGSYAAWGAAGVGHRSDHAPVIVDVRVG